MLVALAIALAWRSAWAPATGALVGLGVALAGGVATRADIDHALADLWRPMISIVGIMATTSCAAELGIFTRLAAWIEPRTRGPVKHAFRFVFAIAALTAAILSNDAAILLVTPVVIELLRAVYPRRNPKFLLPFAFAAFVAAGVAPLPTGNPMNLVVAYRAGIDVNDLRDPHDPGRARRLARRVRDARVVLPRRARRRGSRARRRAARDRRVGGHAQGRARIATGASIVLVSDPRRARPADLAGRAARGADLRRQRRCTAGSRPRRDRRRHQLGAVAVPVRRARAGDRARPRRRDRAACATLYAHTPCAARRRSAAVAAAGSALIDNHPMALLHSLALADAPHRLRVRRAGRRRPRPAPPADRLARRPAVDRTQLRQQGVAVPLATFVRVGFDRDDPVARGVARRARGW